MTAPALVVDQPGVYDGMPEDVYHGDPVPGGSLSSSGARMLLPPSCPALFDHRRKTGEQHKRTFDFGHAAHHEVLGVGAELIVVDVADWRTKAAKEAKAAAYEAGQVPLLADEHGQVLAMAAALRAHPIAGRLLQPGTGQAEQSLFWVDRQTGVWRRARLDFIRHYLGRRSVIVDYKTTTCAHPDALAKAVHSFGYHQQGAWYVDGAEALGLVEHGAVFVLVFQEKTAPYLVTVVELDPTALLIGRELNTQALHRYRECTDAGVWPAYTDDVELVSLPSWVEHRYLKEIS